MAFVLLGEPGNGKTFFVDYLSTMYRDFISITHNNKYTFRFKVPKEIDGYGNIRLIESQTFEDPLSSLWISMTIRKKVRAAYQIWFY